VLVPEGQGGAGLGLVEAGIVLEALGSALAPVSFLATSVAAADAIARLASEEQKARWLPRIAAGQVAASVVGLQEPADVGSDGGLRGRWAPVPCAPDADLLIVLAQERGGGTAVHLVETAAVPDSVADFPTMDRTRRQGAVVLEGVRGERLDAPLTAAEADRLRAILLAGSAAETAGGVARVLDMETRYACERIQFGRPIGTFQAIKHMLADQLVAIEGLRSLVWAALWSIDNAPDEALLAAVAARATADRVGLQSAAENIQVHGGSGFTTDIDAHLYVKRAQADRLAWGPPALHSEYLGSRLEELA
jgi:alkylation response protein AidB-like acyl-CoA dehydrogenase